MQRSLWLSAALLFGGAAACGSSNKVGGDLAFDVKSTRAIVIPDAGAGISVAQIYLMNSDVSCDQLKTYLQASEHPDPNSNTVTFPPFSQGVVIEYPNTTGSHAILKPVTFNTTDGGSSATTPKGDAVLAEVDVFQAFQAISGTVTVTAAGKSSEGSFDTKAIDVESYFDFAFNGGKTDSSGNPLHSDGGLIPQKSITGDFQADVCP